MLFQGVLRCRERTSMTMMSRTSSDSSIDEQGSTVSSKSGARRPTGSLISQNRRMRDSPSDSSDMPSLSSFRLDEMSSSGVSRGDSCTSRGDCELSLPSLSSFRMDEMSLASSYHSGTNHLSEESAEGWSSFTSGNASVDTDSEDEFATRSSVQGPEREDSPGKNVPAISSNLVKDRVSVDSVPDGSNCNLTSNARPPRRRSPEVEEMQSSLPMRRPRRTLSPVENSRIEIPDQGVPGNDDDMPRPIRSSSSPDRTPVERTESLPLSILQRPRSAQGDSTTSVRAPGDSSSSLRGGDSLPRLPLRTSALDDRSGHGEDDVDDDTKISADASRVSDEDTKISYGDVTEVSDGDVSIDSDLSDDESLVKNRPLHQNEKLVAEAVVNSQRNSAGHVDPIKDVVGVVRVENVPGPQADEAETSSESKHQLGAQVCHGGLGTVGPGSQDEDGIPKEPAGEVTDEPESNKVDNDQKESTSAPPMNNSDEQIESNKEDGEPVEAEKAADPEKVEDADSSGNTSGKDGKGPVRNRKSPTSVRELEGTLPAKAADEKAPDESGATSAEESGTTASDTEAEEAEEMNNRRGKKDDSKRGRLLRKMSNSFRSIGKSTSFKNSFKMIGRTASKLKNMGRREDGPKKDG